MSELAAEVRIIAPLLIFFRFCIRNHNNAGSNLWTKTFRLWIGFEYVGGCNVGKCQSLLYCTVILTSSFQNNAKKLKTWIVTVSEPIN